MNPNVSIPEDIRRMSAQCRHYAMCKIDYLETGLCPPAKVKPYVGYFPQGRMDICDALANGLIPVTEAAVDIISSCTLCGICDRQCHFVTGMRPMQVMRALKSFLADFQKRGGEATRVGEDESLRAIKSIVGSKWASNDPAHLVAYSNDPFPMAGRQMPGYVVLPGSPDELVEIVRYADKSGIPVVVRGNGGSVFGFVFTEGIVIDVNRMKKIELDPDNWTAVIEPGVTAFELQKAAADNGYRVNVAEPAATVCGNIVCTGLFSTWANAYGVGADHFVDMTFTDRHGRIFNLNDKNSPNVFGFEEAVLPSPGICTEARVRMHPVTDDEEGILVPFASLKEAIAFVRDLSRRRIGLAVGILGGHYISTFISPTESLATKTRKIFSDILEIAYVVSVVGDRYARSAIKQMVPCIIDGETFEMLVLGLPGLARSEWTDIVKGLELEYDYYIDHTDNAESEKIRQSMVDIEEMIDNLSAAVKGVKWLKYIFSQGCSRKEGFLYT